MKILFIGAHRYDIPELEALSELHEVFVCEDEKLETSDRVHYILLKKSFAFLSKKLQERGKQITLPFYFKKLMPSLRKERPDIIVALDFFRLWSLQALLYRLCNPSSILILRSETQHFPETLYARLFMYMMIYITRLFSFAIHDIHVFTEQGKTYAEKYLLRSATLVPLSIDTDYFTNNTTRVEYAHIHILMLARYAGYKNHMLLLKSLCALPTKNWHLTLASSEETPTTIHEYIQKKNVTSSVTFETCSSREKARELYATSDICILPSDFEAIGLTIPEAMSMGCATITSSSVGANIYVKEKETGLIFKRNDKESLADALYTLLSDYRMTKQMSISASLHMHTFFSKETMAKKYHDVFSSYTVEGK